MTDEHTAGIARDHQLLKYCYLAPSVSSVYVLITTYNIIVISEVWEQFGITFVHDLVPIQLLQIKAQLKM